MDCRSKRILAHRAWPIRFAALCLSVIISITAVHAEPLKRDDAGAHYCTAVFVLAIEKSNKLRSLGKDVDFEAEIKRLKAGALEAARHFRDKNELASPERLMNNPDFFRGENDVKACEGVRRSANVKGCMDKCGSGKSYARCVDACFEAGSDICRRTMSCMSLFVVEAESKVDSQQWTVYAPAGAGYRIAFPGRPEVLGPAGAAVLNQDQFTFAVSYSDVPLGKAPGVDDLRENSVGLVAMSKGVFSLRSERDIKVGTAPAKEFVLDNSKKDLVRLSRHVLVGVRVISAVYFGPRGTEKSTQAQSFLDSLEIVSK